MKSFWVVFLVATFGFLGCTWVAQPTSINRREPLDLAGISKLEVQGIAGNFSVFRGKDSVLSVQGVGSSVEVNVRRMGSTLQIISSGDTNCYPCTVDIEIQVEKPLELIIAASNGKVSVENVATSATLSSGNGAIRIVGANAVTAKSGNGEIYASQLSGQVNLSSSNGKITLENSVLPAASENFLSTGNGDIRVKNVSTTGGFVIRGNRGTPNFALTGFELLLNSNSFTATRAGVNPTTLRLETQNGTIQVNP